MKINITALDLNAIFNFKETDRRRGEADVQANIIRKIKKKLIY